MRVERLLSYYWLLYLAFYMIGVGLLLGLYFESLKGESGLLVLASIFAVSAGGASVLAIVVEAGGLAVLLIPKRVKELMERGRVEGRMEANAEWEAWLRRYREALAAGQEFTESPPSSQNGSSSRH